MPFFKREQKPKFKSKQSTAAKIVSVDEQVSIESQRCAQMISAAEAAVKARNFSQAEDLYSACLPIMEQLYAGDSKAMADCLLALGDVYYWQDKFGMASPIYKRLLTMRERMTDSSPASLVTAYLKNAKTEEHLNNIESAQDMYKRGVEIAQKTLMLGHPLLSSILDSYANFLQEKTSNMGLAEEIRRKAKTSQETYIEPDLLKSEAMAGRVKEQIWKESPVKKEKDPELWKNIDQESNHPLVVALRNLRKHPRMTIAFLTLPITIGLLLVSVSATYYLTGGEAIQTPLLHEKEVFRTADAQQSLTILAKNKMQIRSADEEAEVDYVTLSNPWREMQYFFLEKPKNDVLLYKQQNSLVDSKGRVLEPGNTPTIATIMDMERFGNGLHKINTLTPDSLRQQKLKEYCSQFSYENPYTHSKETPNIMLAEYDSFGRPDQLTDYLKRTRTFNPEALSKRFIIKFVGGKPVYSPALLKCIILPGGSEKNRATFFIVATDGGGALLKQSESGPNLLYNSIAGGEPQYNKVKSEEIYFSSNARVVVSKVSRDDISAAANLLGWVLALLPIMLVGYKVFEPRFNRSQYYSKESMTEVWLSYIYIISLAAYICFFSAVVLFAMSL